MRCGQVSPLGPSAIRAIAAIGNSVMSEMARAATDQPRLPLSLRRASRRRSLGWATLAAVGEAVFASLASGRHQCGHGLSRKALVGVLQRIGEGVGGVDDRIDQIGSREG